MCQIYAGQDPNRFESITRSVRLSGHATSIRLESAFWEILDRIAADDGMTTPKLLSKLYDEVLELRGGVPNFTSMLRTTCLVYLERNRSVPGAEPPRKTASAEQVSIPV